MTHHQKRSRLQPWKKTTQTITALVIGGTLALALSACDTTGKAGQQFADADVSGVNDGPAAQITFPDGFSNVATKCDGPNMVYSAFHGDAAYGAITVVPNDPRCTDG